MGARSKVNWLAVRTYYVGGHSIDECAKKFPISSRSIEKRCSDEKWVEMRRQNFGEAVKVVGQLSAQGTVKKILDHEEFVALASDMAKAIDEDIAAMAPGRWRAETRRLGVEAFERVIKMSRLVRGISEGEASGLSDKPTSKVLRVIVQPPPSKDEIEDEDAEADAQVSA